jgi:hypothetical protein
MKKFLDSIPKLVIQKRNIEEERKKHNRRADEVEALEGEIDLRVNQLDPAAMLARINRGFKGIELIGQIVRNRHGSIDKAILKQMATVAYEAGLRFLRWFLAAAESSQDEVTRMIEHMLNEDPGVRNGKVEKEAEAMFLLLTYGVMFGVLQKIAASIGSREANAVYDAIENETPTPAVKLINLAIELQFQKKVDIARLKELTREFKSNGVCDRLLKETVIQYIYMHYVNYKEKQQLGEVLNLPVARQQSLELERKLKV